MINDPATLFAEIARLRDLLEEHGIDPDPVLPSLPVYTVPTEWEWRMQRIFTRSVEQAVEQAMEQNKMMRFFEGEQWDGAKIGSAVRARLPASFTVATKA